MGDASSHLLLSLTPCAGFQTGFELISSSIPQVLWSMHKHEEAFHCLTHLLSGVFKGLELQEGEECIQKLCMVPGVAGGIPWEALHKASTVHMILNPTNVLLAMVYYFVLYIMYARVCLS